MWKRFGRVFLVLCMLAFLGYGVKKPADVYEEPYECEFYLGANASMVTLPETLHVKVPYIEYEDEAAVVWQREEAVDFYTPGDYVFTGWTQDYVIHTTACVHILDTYCLESIEVGGPYACVAGKATPDEVLPAEVKVTDIYGNTATVPVAWEYAGKGTFDNNVEGSYTFVPILTGPYTYEAADDPVTLEITPRGYEAPEGYYAPVYETQEIAGVDYELKYTTMGLRAYEIEKFFGITSYTHGFKGYYSDVMWAVASWQEEHGLPADGICDYETWHAMGLSDEVWFADSVYAYPVKIDETYKREQIIDAFIETAYEYLGTPYVVGAAGPVGKGCDCSGLVLQCMYSIGIYPDGLSPVQHTEVEYNSRLMAVDDKLESVSLSELLPGDLVFYRRPGGSVCHVAIYVGDGECIENWSGYAKMYPLNKSYMNLEYAGFKRIIAVTEE